MSLSTGGSYPKNAAPGVPSKANAGYAGPRRSSNDSIRPDKTDKTGLRKLLLIYIHGFMGNESSFRNFPAHLHRLLAIFLQDTHVVHSKVFPRFQSKRHITIARDNFGKWLEPHEASTTDVILLGHSMGGLISAEVVLQPPSSPSDHAFKHRVLGAINFDVPFLGMHPGVIKSGLGSIFSPAETPADKYETVSGLSVEGYAPPTTVSAALTSEPPAHTDSFWEPNKPDANFNPSFQNDVVLPARKFWQSVQHFVTKHSDNLPGAAKKLVSSHVEFMAAMGNQGELKSRYVRLRVLEEDSAALRKSVVKTETPPPRVRFVNYYTASTGRPKAPKPAQDPNTSDETRNKETLEAELRDSSVATGVSPSRSPTLSAHRQEGDHHISEEMQKLELDESRGAGDQRLSKRETGTSLDAKPGNLVSEAETDGSHPTTANEHHLDAVMSDDWSTAQSAPSLISELSNVSERSTEPLSPGSNMTKHGSTQEDPKKKLKDRKFCCLPPKDSNGERDPTWVRVFMKDVDEVGAHCGMFFVDERYERLVGDVAARIEQWVIEDLSARFAQEG